MSNWKVLIALVFLLLFGLANLLKAETTVPQKAETVGIDVAQTVKALRKIKTANSLDTTVPLAARPLLTTLKHQLRDLISTSLDSIGGQSDDLGHVRASLVRELQKQGISFKKPEEVETYGDIGQVKLEKVPHHPDLIAATTTIGVYCGEDTSFYVFRRSGKQYKLVIAQEANEYDKVSGAQGWFHYAVSSPDDKGRLFVVTSNVTPWCSSNWRSIRYRVFREGVNSYQPKVLLKREESIYLGNGNLGAITVQTDGFRIEFDAEQGLDGGVHNRKHIAAYRVEGDLVSRVPPFAAEPEGFLDEWLGIPWEEAQKWIEPSEVANLSDWHQRFRAERLSKDSQFFTNFVFDPPACEVEKGLWEVGIEFSPYTEGESLPAGIPEKTYFSVALKDGAYFLKSVSPVSNVPKCKPAGTSP